jgi:hypothetical protein
MVLLGSEGPNATHQTHATAVATRHPRQADDRNHRSRIDGSENVPRSKITARSQFDVRPGQRSPRAFVARSNTRQIAIQLIQACSICRSKTNTASNDLLRNGTAVYRPRPSQRAMTFVISGWLRVSAEDGRFEIDRAPTDGFAKGQSSLATLEPCHFCSSCSTIAYHDSAPRTSRLQTPHAGL